VADSVTEMRGGTARSVMGASIALAVVASVVACAPTAPPAGGPNGCGRPAAPVLTQSRQLTSGGVVRQFLLTIPDSYDPRVPTPLILNFHGLGSDATQQALYTQLDHRAKGRGFIVATPNGIGGAMDVTAPSVDHQYVVELVRYLNSILCVSPFERFSAGMSMGGFMSSALACSPELGLRAIAGVTGLFGACANGRTMPVLAFHGTRDPIVAYAAVRDSVASWAARNRCGAMPQVTRIGPDIQVRTYTGCAAGLSTTFYTVEGGGHTWPDGLIDLPAFGSTTRTIDATDLILDFFSAQ
jgi:polyhydroxybutyrate depolymerase